MKKKAMVKSYSMSKGRKKNARRTRTTTKDPKTGTRTTKTYKKSKPGKTPYVTKGTTTTKTKDGKKSKVSVTVRQGGSMDKLPPLPPHTSAKDSNKTGVKSYGMHKKGRKGLTKAQKTLPKKIQKAIAKKKGTKK